MQKLLQGFLSIVSAIYMRFHRKTVKPVYFGLSKKLCVWNSAERIILFSKFNFGSCLSILITLVDGNADDRYSCASIA